MLGTIWNDCMMVCYTPDIQPGKEYFYPAGVGYKVAAKIRTYLNIMTKHIQENEATLANYNIWYDFKDNICFSGCQFNEFRWFGKDQHFYTTKKRFIDHTMWRYINRYELLGENSAFKKQELVWDPKQDYLYSNPKLFEKYKGKSIMIVGGGPSTRDVAWENLDVDYIWTCNEFYKNEKFENKTVDLVSLAPLVDNHLLGSPLEQQFIDNKDLVAIFPVDRSDLPVQPMLNFANKYPNQSCLYHTRYGSALGTMNRLICMAIFAGANRIYFVGMDGRNPCESNGAVLHAFNGAKPLPTWYQKYGDRFQLRQFIIFYDYLITLQKLSGHNFKIYNLGEGHEYNVSTSITKQIYPLVDEIKKKVGIL